MLKFKGSWRFASPLHRLDQIIELLRCGVGRYWRRFHVVGLEQVGKIRFAFGLPEKLVHAALALHASSAK